MNTLVDSNVLIDLIVEDPVWAGWSHQSIERASADGDVLVNPLIYAELSAGPLDQSELDACLRQLRIKRCSLPWDAAFPTGKAFRQYRRAGGEKRSPLPDFYIGAHAEAAGLTLLTRDARRFQTYFPKLSLISPPQA